MCACVVCTHVCGVVKCVCLCVCSYMGLYCFVCCKYVGIYVYIMVSWFLLCPPFQFCCRRVEGLCLEYMLVCVYTYTRVRVYTHMCTQCVHVEGCAHANAWIGLHTHIQARIHVYACMYVRPAHRGMTRP
jgi:hypothetical protein